MKVHSDLQNQFQYHSDKALWDSFKQGDKSAFAFIYYQYLNTLFNYGMKVVPDRDLVKDCLQELFISLWKNRQNLSQTDSIKYYLFKAFRRSLIKEVTAQRKFYSEEDYTGNEETLVLPMENDIINREISQHRQEILKKGLSQISLRQQEVLNLLFYENYSYEQASHILGINIKSVYTLAWKAFSSLKKYLNQP